MLNNRKRVNYAIYEEIKEAGTGEWGKTEYCVLCRKNGIMDLWGQINIYDNGEYYAIEIRYSEGVVQYAEYYNSAERHMPKFIRTITFKNEKGEEVGRLSLVKAKKSEQHIQILDCGEKQVSAQRLMTTGALRLEFSDDGEYDEKQSPWYFRRFDDPLMAAMIHDERENVSDKFKERYGVILPEDISGEMAAILLTLPFVY